MNINTLHKLERKEKIRIVQLLWDDIANDQEYTYVSSEHKKILDDRINHIERGVANFKPLKEIEQKFNSFKK